MGNVKTAISLQKALFDQVDALAHEKKVSRSRLFAMALEDYLRREQNRKLAEQLNAVYGGEPDPEEEALRRKMKRQFRKRVEGEW